MKKYFYKHIEVFQTWGTWQANYNDGTRSFALHRACSRTRAKALELAKQEINYLNETR